TVSTAPKSPGVIMLEHELTTYSVNAFIQHTWPGISKYGWKFNSIPELFGLPWYANSFNNTTPNSSQTSFVKSAIVAGGNSNGTSSTGSTTAASGSGTSAAGASPSTSAQSSKKGAAAASVSASTSSLLALLGSALVAAVAL
ncbi:hypothetical protein OC845_006854, partial [Tilletia horrida]